MWERFLNILSISQFKKFNKNKNNWRKSKHKSKFFQYQSKCDIHNLYIRFLKFYNNVYELAKYWK